MEVQTFSTVETPEARRALRFEREMRDLFAVGLALRGTGDQPVAAQMRAFRGRRLHCAALRFSPHETTAQTFPGQSDRLIVTMHKEGYSTVVQDGREARLAPGDFVVVDPCRPFFFDTGEILTHSIYLPLATVRELTPHLGQLTARTLSSQRGGGALFASLVNELFQTAPSLSDEAADRIADALPYLLASALADLGGDRELAEGRLKLMHRGRIQRYARENLRNPALDVQMIAAAVNLSPRYVYQLFAEEPLTLMKWVWSERLERCRTELEQPALRAQTIGEIAFGWGFNDLAHFSRAFRGRYGCSPREHRRTALATIPALAHA